MYFFIFIYILHNKSMQNVKTTIFPGSEIESTNFFTVKERQLFWRNKKNINTDVM